jgi:hypothetical protein
MVQTPPSKGGRIMDDLDGIRARTREEWLMAVLAILRATFASGNITLPAVTATTGMARGSARGSSHRVVEIARVETAGEAAGCL